MTSGHVRRPAPAEAIAPSPREALELGTDSLNPDGDLDTHLDGDEVRNGTNPLDPDDT